MKKFFTITISIILIVAAVIAGYAYGFGAYNRPIRWWEFWLRK
jgi:hypothetical protein